MVSLITSSARTQGEIKKVYSRYPENKVGISRYSVIDKQQVNWNYRKYAAWDRLNTQSRRNNGANQASQRSTQAGFMLKRMQKHFHWWMSQFGAGPSKTWGMLDKFFIAHAGMYQTKTCNAPDGTPYQRKSRALNCMSLCWAQLKARWGMNYTKHEMQRLMGLLKPHACGKKKQCEDNSTKQLWLHWRTSLNTVRFTQMGTVLCKSPSLKRTAKLPCWVVKTL